MRAQKIAGAIAISGLSATSVYAAGPFSYSQEKIWDFFNTTSGIGALSSNVTPNQTCWPYLLSAKTVGSYYVNGCFNTATGFFALKQNTTGGLNTADGAAALYNDNVGFNNTAVGTFAMFSTTSGQGNAALGAAALFANTTGKHSTALGAYSLFKNTTGISNTAVGQTSMYSNLSGSGNTAMGRQALYYNLAGNQNVAVGVGALYNNKDSPVTSPPAAGNTSSSYNVAIGVNAMYNNTTGAAAGNNTAVGYLALYNNGGVSNTALGSGALQATTTGTGNTAVGDNAGNTLTIGGNNTYIGNGVTGTAADNYVTKIGVPNAASTAFIAGVNNSPIAGGLPVVVNSSTGQLGYSASSERYKTDINSLGTVSGKLAQLRVVSFHVKGDPNGTIQYGLIAEEVQNVYPELVIRDNVGRIQGVRYDELAPMVLREVQNEQSTVASLVAEHDADAAKIASLEQQLARIQEILATTRPLGDKPVTER